jgi:hypothetical protein
MRWACFFSRPDAGHTVAYAGLARWDIRAGLLLVARCWLIVTWNRVTGLQARQADHVLERAAPARSAGADHELDRVVSLPRRARYWLIVLDRVAGSPCRTALDHVDGSRA